jgi:DNA-binding GntR family transcriptional regulator
VTKQPAPRRSTAAANSPGIKDASGWKLLERRTFVDQAVEAIMAGAARGLILPGDRIVESDVAGALGISRVPVREALRILESQGVVESEPYKGIRLMPVTGERLAHALDVRVVLEVLAANRAIEAGRNTPHASQSLTKAVDRLKLAARRKDPYDFGSADTAFHRELCRLSRNEVLCAQWESLARQLTIIFGLSVLRKPMDAIVAEHELLVKVFRDGDPSAVERELEEHILAQVGAMDFAGIIADRRAQRMAAAS